MMVFLNIRAAVVLALTVFLGLLVDRSGGKQPNRAIIPAYIYPATDSYDWNRLLNAIADARLPKKKVWIILNANNGVIGDVSDFEKDLWKNMAERVRQHAQVLVYINLCNKTPPFASCGDANLQGARPAAEDLGYLDDWIEVLGNENISGVFLDDTPMDGITRKTSWRLFME